MTKELHLDSQDVAAYITKFCADENYFINLTKLQKLMYCVYPTVISIFFDYFPHYPVLFIFYSKQVS